MIIVISGPSGVGKGTLVKKLQEARMMVRVPISHTTRRLREGESNGVQYFFVNRLKFWILRLFGFFVESASYAGNLYGTSWRELHKASEGGYTAVLEIECQGAKQVMKKFPRCISIFIVPPSVHELRTRLEKRGRESPEEVRQRLIEATREMGEVLGYQYHIVNAGLEDSSARLIKLYDHITSGREPDLTEFSNPTVLRSALTMSTARI